MTMQDCQKQDYDYIRDGDAIYAQSFAIIRAEADLSAFSVGEAELAVRMIHAAGSVEAIFSALANFGWSDAALIAFLAYPATLLGGGIWSWLLGRHPASVVAPFTLLVPITGILSGCLILGEVITGVEIAGGLLVIAGLIVTLRKAKNVEPAIRLD